MIKYKTVEVVQIFILKIIHESRVYSFEIKLQWTRVNFDLTFMDHCENCAVHYLTLKICTVKDEKLAGL